MIGQKGQALPTMAKLLLKPKFFVILVLAGVVVTILSDIFLANIGPIPASFQINPIVAVVLLITTILIILNWKKLLKLVVV